MFRSQAAMTLGGFPATFTTVTVTGLTAGRVVFTGTGGLLSASANLAYSGGNSLVLTGDFYRAIDGVYSGYIGKASALVSGGGVSELAVRSDADMVLTAGGATRLLTLKSAGVVNIAGLPTSAAGLTTGDLWNDTGTLKVA
jgi:hypothetical protein